MKRLLQLLATLFLLLLLSAQKGNAQPHTYIMPDVGTPGMNTYVEVLSTADSIGKFIIADGFASPLTLSVKLRIPGDSARVRISPGMVSWDGRLLSFQFFVKPGATLGAIPLQIQVNATLFNIDTFYIVAPQTFGTKSGGGTIGSGGAWGTRSRRGAMIVDSMILNSGNYDVSTTDTDPNRLGNQGYFPLIVLSRGRISINAGATLSVNGNGKHGGPGGGGGGGYGPSRVAFPVIPGERDAPQGDGFVGGSSAVPFAGSPGPFGTGTGASSASINNVKASTAFSTQRFFGSGPGHPFDRDGRSGGAGALGGGVPLFGIYQGGGGNATAGTGLPVAAPTQVNGQQIGNSLIMPIHGGAGGAGGGPNDSIGGGGGGGIALYSEVQTTIATENSRGANGRNGFNGTNSGDPGAGGAGGCIVVGAKRGVRVTTVNLDGGTPGTASPTAPVGSTAGSGGIGRFRNDGRNIGAMTVTTGASRYTGPTIDTLTFADTAQWTIRGTGRYRPVGGGDTIQVFIRGDYYDWNYGSPYQTVVQSDSTWSVRVTFPFDTIAYVYAVQLTDTTGSTEYTRIPVAAFSQSAASIVKLQLIPEFVIPSGRSFGTVICPGIIYDTIIIRNTGTGLLIIKPGSGFIGANNLLYSIVYPPLPDSTRPGDTFHIIVAFNAAAATDGNRGSILRLLTNDVTKLQIDINYAVTKEARNYQIVPKVINMGGVQLGNSKDTTITYTNSNTFIDQITAIDLINVSGQATYQRTFPNTLPAIQNPGRSITIGFRFTPRDTNLSTAKFIIRSGPCNQIDTVYFSGRGVTGVVESKKVLRFGALACADTAFDSVWVRNVGNAPLILFYPKIVGNDSLKFTIISPPNVGFPKTIPIGDSLKFVVRADGAGVGSLLAALEFQNSDSLYRKNPYYIDLNADRDPAILQIEDTLINIGTLCVGKTIEPTVQIENPSLRANVTVVRITHSDSTGPLTVIPPNAYPFDVSANSFITIKLRVSPTAPGFYRDTLIVRSSPCNRILRVPIVYSALNADLTANPDPIDFGDVQVGVPTRRTVVITNNNAPGGATVSIDSLFLKIADPQVRIISPTIPPLRNLMPGDTMEVTLEYQPSGETRLKNVALVSRIIAPCLDTIAFDVNGNGIRSAVGVSRNQLTLAIPPCVVAANAEDTLTVFNSGTAPVTITGLTATPGVFTVVSPAPPILLAPKSGKSIRVRFTPTGAGVVNGTLDFTTNDASRPNFSVTLRGRRDTIGLATSVKRLVFPKLISCLGSLQQTLTLYNTGTITDTIIPVNTIPATAFQVAQLPPYYIKAGDSLKITINFAPVADGSYSALLVMGVGSCGGNDTVVLEGERVTASQTLSNLDFGDVTFGGAGNAFATVTNNNPAVIRIRSAQILPPSADFTITPGQFPIVIPPLGSAPITATFAPSALGDIPVGVSIRVDIDSVCSLTLTAPVTGRAIEGGVATNRSRLDFGKRLECAVVEDTVVVRNVGQDPLTVTGASITPPASLAFFTISGGTLTPPHLLQPGDSASVIVRFTAASGVDGLRAGVLEITTDDTLRPKVDVPITGERTSNGVRLSGPGFPPVGSGSSQQVGHWIVNTGTSVMTIEKLALLPPFAVVSTTPILPVTLQPGDSLLVDLEFAPTTSGTFTDSIAVGILAGCDTLRLAVSGVGEDRTVLAATATWETMTGRPGDIVRIALRTTDSLTRVPITGFTASARYNPSLLIPIGVSFDGTIASGWTVTGQSIVGAGNFQFSATGTTPLVGPGILAFFEARVALGDSIATFISSGDTAGFSNLRASLAINRGLFTLDGVCMVGGSRLVLANGAFGLRAVRPNPTVGTAEVEFETVESGRTQLLLYDALGGLAGVVLDEVLDPRSYVVALSTTTLPAGIYYLELRSPTQREKREIIVIK
jgi:hypothetical protein